MPVTMRPTLLASIALSVAACSGSSATHAPTTPQPASAAPVAAVDPTPAPAAPEPAAPVVRLPAQVIVVHAVPVPEAASVNLFLDNSAEPAFPALAFGARSGARATAPGPNHLTVRPAAAANDSPPLARLESTDLDADKTYLLIAHGGGTSGSNPQLSVTDDTSPPEAADGAVRLRFFHGISGVGAIDVCLPGATARAPATPVFVNSANGVWATPMGANHVGDYASIAPSDAVRLQVRERNDRPCVGGVLGVVTLNLTAAHGVSTAVALGRATAAPLPQVLLCPTGPGACVTAPVRPR